MSQQTFNRCLMDHHAQFELKIHDKMVRAEKNEKAFLSSPNESLLKVSGLQFLLSIILTYFVLIFFSMKKQKRKQPKGNKSL